MSARRLHLVLAVLTAIPLVFWPAPSRATQKFGPVQLSGNLQSQNLVRHQDASHYQYVQNRNTAKIRFEYKWMEAGKFYNKYDLPFLESSSLFVLYRGVYDSIYDTTPDVLQKVDIHGRAYGGGTQTIYEAAKSVGQLKALQLEGLGRNARNAFKFDNQLREAYADIKFRVIPLTVRAGKQQIVWGETDNFRMLDRVNPLDATWHLQQEIPPPSFGWDEIRRTFWMFKFLYDLDNVGPLSQSFLEWFWNPGDWYPAKIGFRPRPWSVPFLDPFTNPVDGAFIGGVCASSPIRRNGLGVCTRLNRGTSFFKQGDYNRNPLENSQVGVRFHSLTPQGLEFTLNYFYQRWGGLEGTNSAPIAGIPRTFNTAVDGRNFQNVISKGIFPAEFIAPYVHTLGLSANYSEENYTQAVFRAETVYDVGIPFFDVAKVTLVDSPSLPGIQKKNMWKGMIGFDRPTWIKAINKKTTVFFTGQFFWHYLVNNPSCKAQEIANLPADQRGAAGSCLVGALDIPSSARNSAVSFRDKIRDWESIFTLAAFTFYRGGSIVPLLGIAVDPVNQFNMEPFWMIDYVLREDLVVNLTQRYFVTPRGHSTPIFETWGLGGQNAGRSETSLRLTFQF